MAHTGWNEIGEYDDVMEEIMSEKLPESQGNTVISGISNSGEMPELSLQKCSQYTIGKDSFTEIVLLSVISYFCVSTEQRFINMNNEKSINEGITNRSLNNSNQLLRSTKD